MPGGVYRESGQHGNYDQSTPVWKGGVAVTPGDHCFRDTDGYDKPLNLFPWTTDLATTLAALKPLLRGVSMARRYVTQTADGGITDGNLIATGEFWGPLAPGQTLGAAAKPGDYVTAAKDTGNALLPQAVAVTATQAAAIGKVSRDAPVGQAGVWYTLMVPGRSTGGGA